MGGVVGVNAYIGPTVTAKVNGSTATETACWSAEVANDVTFHAFLHLLKFLSKDVAFGPFQIGKAKSYSGCLARSAVFVGSPGTGAPPAKLGPYKMTAFAADPTVEGTNESRISGPTGAIAFDAPLRHDLVGSDWATWSHGYTGSVYQNDTVLPNGDLQITVTLPPGTGAFYAYAEPNEFKDHDMSAATKGASSGNVTVFGNAGAHYFGFYAPCGHTLSSITYTDSGADSAMAIGEFGIARSC